MREEQRPPIEEITELAPNIRRIQLPMNMPGLGHVNCYVLDDDQGAALVDPGLPGPGPWRALKAGLKRAGLRVRDIHTVVITHSHPDPAKPLQPRKSSHRPKPVASSMEGRMITR